MQEEELTPRRYMSWPVLSLLVFITVIGFENIFYPFQNQGLSVVVNWVILLVIYIVPYALISAQLGTTFTRADEGGGLATWGHLGILDKLDLLGSDPAIFSRCFQRCHRGAFLDDSG